MGGPNASIDPAVLNWINRAFGVVGLLIGLGFLAGGAYFIHRNHLDEFFGIVVGSETAEGTVVENRAIEVHPGQTSRTLPFTSYQAIVSFTDADGRSITLADPLAFRPPSFRVGQKVKVFYDPGNPEHTMIDRGAKNFAIPGICLVFGGLSVVGSIQRLARGNVA